MSTERHPRLQVFRLVFGAVTLLAVLNAFAPWGVAAAHRGEAILQLTVAAAGIVCGLVGARRVSGMSRWWRLTYISSMVLWLAGQALWWMGYAEDGASITPVTIANLLLPAIVLVGVMLLVRSSGKVFGREGLLGHPPLINLIDGIGGGLSFLVLASMGGFSARSSMSLPRSGIPAVEMAFALAEVVIVGIVVLIVMVFDPDRPYRTNFLLLAGGLILMCTSDRFIAYSRTIGAVGGELFGGIGLILGPLVIAFSMFEYPQQAAEDDHRNRSTDWAQLILPYATFPAIAVLFAFHVLSGRSLQPFAVCVVVVMVVLVTVRQVIAVRAQWLLTQRLYRAQRGLAHQVHHDSLTGLPNRLLFAKRLDEARLVGGFVLIFIDLDDFKDINDRFGHAAGDELLCAVGERFRRCVGENDTLARIGGDEFAILIHEKDMQERETVSDRLRSALRDPFPLQGSLVRVRASLGVVRSGAEDGPETSDDLLRHADISMYAGKRLGKNTAVFYQPLTGIRADFPAALRAADGGVPAGFSLVYQPIVRLPEGTTVAVEALARWAAPNGMHIVPETFVAAAEAAGLGAALDNMVLDLACAEVRAAGLDVDIHVNIGAARLGNMCFEEHVMRTLARHRIAQGRLVVEITETVPIVDLANSAAQIARLNATGVRVALDDFGAGYNSLTYLHALPVQMVKLDRSLAANAEPVRDLALYRSVIRLCADLGLDVIAEGIETTAQLDIIQAAGCHLAQGHLFRRPAPIEDIASEVPSRGAVG